MKKLNDKEQRVIDSVNLNNTGTILTNEAKIIKQFIDNKKPVLDKKGQDITGRGHAMNLYGAFMTVIQYLNQRVEDLEKKIKEDK